jgi:tight adherence protein B
MTLPAFSLPAVLGILATTLALAVWSAYEFASGWDQRRALVARSTLDEAEARANTLMARFDAWYRRTDLGKYVGRRLTAAGMRTRASTFTMLMVLAAVIGVYAISTYMAPLFGALAAIGICLGFFAYVRRKEDRRKEEFIGQLPELARVLSNASSAGLVMRTAIEMAAEELGEPASTELRRTADSLRIGQPVDEALRELGERLPSRELSVLVSTMVVSSRAGGSLVTALRNIATTLEERKEIRREVLTIMGEAKITNWAIGFIGLGALFVVNLSSPGALRQMSGELPGQIILGIAGGAFLLSLLIIRKITKIEV